jgi:alginate O-acetyltransferase complex protein AlgI
LRATHAWLLFASVLFYAWGELRLLWIMLGSCVLNYVGGLLVVGGRRGRRPALVTVVAANLAVLAWFKYSGLLADLANRINALLGHSLGQGVHWTEVALPVGISFYTFHGISYVVDVWRGKIGPARNLLDFACYYTLFPQLVAGPIVRYAEVGASLERRLVSLDDLAEGARRFIIGLGKKTLVANQVAVLADAVFALRSADRTPAAAWLGLTAYAVQIYFDFSGYSDMAVGLGRIFGFRFPENFDYPYIARSIREFWRRWHMTLSRFFRDYLYIPLGGNRGGAARTCLNLFLVFALCGLWHGASWNFLFWGLFHGFFLASERVLEPWTSRAPAWTKPLAHVYTIVVVLLSWVVFRCDTWAQARDFYRALLPAHGGLDALPWVALAPNVLIAFAAGLVFSTPIATLLRASGERGRFAIFVEEALAFIGTAAVLVLCLCAIGAGSHNPFIYYRF